MIHRVQFLLYSLIVCDNNSRIIVAHKLCRKLPFLPRINGTSTYLFNNISFFIFTFFLHFKDRAMKSKPVFV